MSKVKFQNPLAFLQNSKISGHEHVSYICFKNIAKLHVQANNLPQIRLNV